MKNNKLLSIFSLALIGGVLVSCSKNEVLSFEILRPSYLDLKAQFRASSAGAAGSSNVYIDENGQIITINDPNDPSVSAVQELEITEPVISMFYSDFQRERFNETKQLKVSVKPVYARTGTITWESSNPAVASVDANGLVTALTEGTSVITATSENGSSASSRIVVNNTNCTLSEAAKSIYKIAQVQASSEFTKPGVVYTREVFDERRVIGGETTSHQLADVRLYASKPDAYFRYHFIDNESMTAGGNMVPYEAQYLMYTTPEYYSYIFNLGNGKANYMVIDQGFLIKDNKSPLDGLGEVLGSFFTSGAGIMSSQFEDALGADEIKKEEFNTDAKYWGSFGENSGQFAYYQVEKDLTATVSIDQEDSLGIPGGTEVTVKNQARCLWENNLLSYKHIEQIFEYELDGQQCTYEIVGDMYYQTENVKLLWPNLNECSLVDSIGDL